MSKKRGADNWDSDEELLGDTPGIGNYPKSAELDVLNTEGELEDEDALLSLETDTSHANTINHGSGYYNSDQDHVQDEQAFVFEDVDTGDLEDELNVGGEEESGFQDQVYQGDGEYEEGYQGEDDEYPDDTGIDSSGAAQDGSENLEVAVSYEQPDGETAVELQYDDHHDSEREIVLQYGDGGDGSTEVHVESNQPAAEHESESDSDDEDSRNNRGRFKTERTGVISLATSKERTSIPDTLEINDEQAEQINKFMSEKGQPSQRGGKKAVGGRGERPSVHSRLGARSGNGPRPGMGPPDAQGPGLIQGPRPPFPLGLPGPLNPRMLMGIIRGGGMQALRGILPPGLMGPRGPLGMRMGRPRGPMPSDGLGPRGPFPNGPRGQRGPFPNGPPGQRGPFPDGAPRPRGPFPDGAPRPRGPFPDGPPRQRGPFPDGPPRQRGPFPDGPMGQRGPFPMRGPGGMNLRGRMPGPPGPRGPSERGPFPSGPQPRGPNPNQPGPRGPPLPLPPGLNMGPPGSGPPQRLRAPGPGSGPPGMMMRGPRGPPPRPLLSNEGPSPGMLRSPSPMKSPELGNRGSTIHDRLGPRVPIKGGQDGKDSAQSSQSSGAMSEGQPIPSLVKSVSVPASNHPPGMNQGNRPPRPQMNANFRQPNPRGPRPLNQNAPRHPVGGHNKIFINPRFQKPDDVGPTGITRTVRIGTPLHQRRPPGFDDKAHGNVVERVPVIATKRRSEGGDDVPNKIIRIGDNRQQYQDQQQSRNYDHQNQRNVVLQNKDGMRDRLGPIRRSPLGRRLGPHGQGPHQGTNVPVKGPNSSVQSRLGPPIAKRNDSNIVLTSSSQQVSFNPNVAPPNLPPRGPPPNPSPPRHPGPPQPSASMFSKPPPGMPPIRGPPPQVPVTNRFSSPPPGPAPPPGSAAPPRFSGPPLSAPPTSAGARFSAPPPTLNVAQPPPGFSAQPPPRFQPPAATQHQPQPTFHSTPSTVATPAAYHPPPASQIPPHYPPPAPVVVAIPTYTQPPPTQGYAAPPPAIAVAPASHPPPTTVYQPPPGYPPSHAQPYQHPPAPAPAPAPAPTAVSYKPAAPATTYQAPHHQPAPSTQHYSLDYYSATRAHYQAPAATQTYQTPHSSSYNYSSASSQYAVASTMATHSSYESEAVHPITTIGRRAQPATDSQVRSILHNVAPSRSSNSSSQSHASDRVVVDTSVSVLKGPQKVAIYNLAQMATKETLVKVCRHFGRVLNVQLFRELNKAIVQFETGEQAAKCVSKCDQKCLHKSRLTVKLLPD